MKGIYLDHAATTALSREVLDDMMPYLTEVFGNSHSQHMFGREAAKGVDKARLQVANAINCDTNEVYFTGSGSEANNWAIKGVATAHMNKGKHIIISSIEHHSILNCAEQLDELGFEVTYLPVDEYGFIKLDAIKAALRPDTTLVSTMYVNNEIGTIQQIKEISKLVHANKSIFHVDAVQAMGSIKVDVEELGADLLTISAHKFYGPKGVGALYIKNGLRIQKLIVGGGQERSMRGGTTNTAAVVGMGSAIERAVSKLDEYQLHCAKLRDHFIQRIQDEIPYVKLNGATGDKRSPNNVNFSFQYVEGESILMLLDNQHIAVSSGSACSSGSLEPSHVLKAIGVPIALSHGSIRFSFGWDNDMQQIDTTVDSLKEIIAKLRAMSPLFSLKKGEIKNV